MQLQYSTTIYSYTTMDTQHQLCTTSIIQFPQRSTIMHHDNHVQGHIISYKYVFNNVVINRKFYREFHFMRAVPRYRQSFLVVRSSLPFCLLHHSSIVFNSYSNYMGNRVIYIYLYASHIFILLNIHFHQITCTNWCHFAVLAGTYSSSHSHQYLTTSTVYSLQSKHLSYDIHQQK